MNLTAIALCTATKLHYILMRWGSFVGTSWPHLSEPEIRTVRQIYRLHFAESHYTMPHNKKNTQQKGPGGDRQTLPQQRKNHRCTCFKRDTPGRCGLRILSAPNGRRTNATACGLDSTVGCRQYRQVSAFADGPTR